MKLYISGPMNGYDNLNEFQFRETERELKAKGYEVIVPHDLEPEFGTMTITDSPTPNNYIRGDLIEMLKCDGVAIIGNVVASWGATIEIDLAHRVGIPVRPAELW